MNVATLRGDFFGGLTAAVVALPLALAFGVQSGMGAIAGLYGAIGIGIVAACLGGTNTQISGPTGPMTVVSAVFIATAIEKSGGLDAALGAIIVTFILCGVLQVCFAISQIGQYVQYIPYPVVSGFMSGIGAIIILLQIFPVLGHSTPKKILEIFAGIPGILPMANISSVILAAATIAIIYIFPRISKSIPSTLVALIVLTIVSTVLDLKVAIIDDIPAGLPKLMISEVMSVDFSQLSWIVMPALTLAALGCIDSLLTSVVADNMTRTRHNSNKELIGQGLGNIAAALIGGIPGAGATMRTVININSGGVTRLSGIIHGLSLLIVLLGASAYARLIPLPVLAGILITVGIGIIDYKGLKHLVHVPKSDAAVMIIVLALTVFVDLLQAVAVGMILSCILFMKKMGEIVENNTEIVPVEELMKESPWLDESVIPDRVANKIYIKHLEGPVFFGFASALRKIAASIPEVKVVIIRMKLVPYIDQTGLYAIEDAVLSMREKGITVFLTEIRSQPVDMMRTIGLIPNLVPESYVFDQFESSVKQLESILANDDKNAAVESNPV